MIQVCCAIIRKDSLILAVQRGPVSSHPWKWEFPGGKIELGETAKQCILREVSEELTINVEVLMQLEAVEFDYGSKQIRLIPFVCEIVSGEIILTEHQTHVWFNFGEWETMDWSGADRELIQRNLERLKMWTSGKEM